MSKKCWLSRIRNKCCRNIDVILSKYKWKINDILLKHWQNVVEILWECWWNVVKTLTKFYPTSFSFKEFRIISITFCQRYNILDLKKISEIILTKRPFVRLQIKSKSILCFICTFIRSMKAEPTKGFQGVEARETEFFLVNFLITDNKYTIFFFNFSFSILNSF